MTVAELVTKLKAEKQTFPVRVLDRGSDTRDWELFAITRVEQGAIGEHPVVFIEVRPS